MYSGYVFSEWLRNYFQIANYFLERLPVASRSLWMLWANSLDVNATSDVF